MVQILPYVPSFGEKLASSFGQAAGNIGSAYFEDRKKKSSIERIREYEGQINNLHTPLDDIENASTQSVQNKKLRPIDVAEVYSDYKNAYGEEAANFKTKQFVEMQKEAREKQEKQQIKQAEDEILTGVVNSLEENLKYTGSAFREPTWKGFISRFPGGEASEKKADFDSSALQLADAAYREMIGKGITDATAKIVVDKVAPNSKFSQAENRGRLEAIKRIKNIKSNNPAEATKESMKIVKQVKEGKLPITEEIAIKFYQEANGDPKLASELAKQSGYDV